MKRTSKWLIGMMVAVVVGLGGLTLLVQDATAFNSHKLVTLRGKLLASIVWSPAGTDGLGSLFSTSSYDTSDYPNSRPEQERSMRGPIICWSRLDQLISMGSTTIGNTATVSVFIQHAPNDVEGEFVNLMYLSSGNRGNRGSGFGANQFGGQATLTSTMIVVDSYALAAVSDGAFGRYIRARFQGNASNNGDVGVRAWVMCDIAGDSIVK